MSCCGQKRSEQKRRLATGAGSAADAGQGVVWRGPTAGRARPGDPPISGAARLAYLTRNCKLFAR